MKFIHLSVLSALLSIVGIAQAAPQYSVSLLGLVNAHPSTYTPAINNALISGYGYTESNQSWNYYSSSTAATWQYGVATALTALHGASNSLAHASNLNGQTVGLSWTKTSMLPLSELEPTQVPYDGQATLWNQGTATLLPGLYNSYGYASDINNQGQVIGWSLQGKSGTVGTVWNNSIPTALASFAGQTMTAFAINDQGIIVGRAEQENYATNAVFWNSQNQVQLLPSLRGQGGNGEASAINGNGIIAGTSDAADGRQHATIWVDGQAVDLGLAGGWASYAYGINNHGDVVGSYIGDYEGVFGEYALLWQNGVAINLNSLKLPDNLVLVDAQGINDRGYIIARGYVETDSNGYPIYGSYLLAPVPEPSSYALMLAGLALISVSRRKR